MGNCCPSQTLQKVDLLKETPNISTTDFELLLSLENLLKSEKYSAEFDDLVSEVLDDSLRKQPIVNLISLLKSLSPTFNSNFKVKDNKISDIKLRMNFNISTLIEIIKRSNNKRKIVAKYTPIKKFNVDKISDDISDFVSNSTENATSDCLKFIFKFIFLSLIIIAGCVAFFWALPAIIFLLLMWLISDLG